MNMEQEEIPLLTYVVFVTTKANKTIVLANAYNL